MIELKIRLDDIDYSAAAETLMPMISQHLAEDEDANMLFKFAGKNPGATSTVAKAALAVMSQKKKDELAAKLIRKYREKIAQTMLDMAKEKGIKVTVKDIIVSTQES